MTNESTKRIGAELLTWIENAGLVVIALATIAAFGFEIRMMIDAGKVQLADLLLMFIYLEVLTMVGLYLQSGQLPVRMPLYIGIVALARYMILDVKDMDAWRVVAVAAAILLMALAVLVIRYGHVRFPYGRELEQQPASRPAE